MHVCMLSPAISMNLVGTNCRDDSLSHLPSSHFVKGRFLETFPYGALPSAPTDLRFQL